MSLGARKLALDDANGIAKLLDQVRLVEWRQLQQPYITLLKAAIHESAWNFLEKLLVRANQQKALAGSPSSSCNLSPLRSDTSTKFTTFYTGALAFSFTSSRTCFFFRLVTI